VNVGLVAANGFNLTHGFNDSGKHINYWLVLVIRFADGRCRCMIR
jgi:hypothetical protein